MKKLVAIFLLLVVLLPYTTKIGVVAYYCLNYEYIFASICENKDNPLVECKGQCFLAKKMLLEKEKNNFLERLYTEVLGIKQNYFLGVFEVRCFYQQAALPPYVKHQTRSGEENIFRPPRFFDLL